MGTSTCFWKEKNTKKIDPGKINGVGGKVDPGENYLQAAIREIEEETGYQVSAKDMKLVAVVQLEEGYSDNWIMCFFKAEVPSKEIPIGNSNNEGELIWLQQEQVLGGEYKVVDDLNYLFEHIVSGEGVAFMRADMDENDVITSKELDVIDYWECFLENLSFFCDGSRPSWLY